MHTENLESPVTVLTSCPLCKASRLTQLITLPISVFLGSRTDYYRFDVLGLTGQELLGYAKCGDCGFICATPTLRTSLESATYNEAKENQGSVKQWGRTEDSRQLFSTHHKWVDFHPFVLALGYHMDRFRHEANPGRRLRLLDYGCGYGHTLELARTFGIDGVGCDLDRSRLSVCRDKGLNVLEPAAVDGTFDIVISSNVIEHVYDLDGYLRHISASLDRNGIFVFSGLDQGIVRIETRRGRYKLLHPIEHRNIFTRLSLQRLLEKYELRLIRPTEVVATMRKVRSRAPYYLQTFLTAGYSAVRGVFSALAVRR